MTLKPVFIGQNRKIAGDTFTENLDSPKIGKCRLNEHIPQKFSTKVFFLIWAIPGLFFLYFYPSQNFIQFSITGVFLSIFGHFRIVFSNLFGLPGFDSANGRESWVGVHHPPPGSTGTGVLPGPRDIACQTRCPLMLILSHRILV